MSVNGNVKTWEKGGVRVRTYELNKEFTLNDCSTPIQIRVGGWERDSGGESGGLFDFTEDNDDALSDFSVNHPAPDADASVLRSYTEHTQNATGAYRMHYEIVRACKETRFLSLRTIRDSIAGQADALEKVGAQFKANDDEALLNLAFRRISRAGWRVVGTTADGFLLEGVPPIIRSRDRNTFTRGEAGDGEKKRNEADTARKKSK